MKPIFLAVLLLLPLNPPYLYGVQAIENADHQSGFLHDREGKIVYECNGLFSSEEAEEFLPTS